MFNEEEKDFLISGLNDVHFDEANPLDVEDSNLVTFSYLSFNPVDEYNLIVKFLNEFPRWSVCEKQCQNTERKFVTLELK